LSQVIRASLFWIAAFAALLWLNDPRLGWDALGYSALTFVSCGFDYPDTGHVEPPLAIKVGLVTMAYVHLGIFITYLFERVARK
jgi:hypothetical protein